MNRLSIPALIALPALLSAQDHGWASYKISTQDPFQATHYYNVPGANNSVTPPIPQNLPAGYRGFLLLTDLSNNADIDIDQIDVRLTDDGSTRFTWGTAPGVPGGTGLIGHHAVANVYTTPMTWQGDWSTSNGLVPKIQVPPGAGSPWTLVATGTLTVRSRLEHSPIRFCRSFTIPAGTCGFLVEVGPVTDVAPNLPYQQPPYALHPSLLLPGSAPGAQMGAQDQFVTLTNLDILNQAFVTLPIPQPKSPVFEIHYDVSHRAGYFAAFGSGCYDRPGAFYQMFEPSTPSRFDLGNSGFRMTPNGGGYRVTRTGSSIATPTSVPLSQASGLALGDDTRTGVLPLGFTFPYQGGSTDSIVVTSNGNIFLDPPNSGSQAAIFEPFGIAGFLKGQPQIAALWTDMDPTLGGSVHLDVDTTGPVAIAYVTWWNVAEWYTPGSSNTVQVALHGDGVVEVNYGNCANTRSRCLVGFNPGWSAHDPGMRNLSRQQPFSTGDLSVPPVLGMDARPVLGTTPNLTVVDIPAGTTGLVVMGEPTDPRRLDRQGMPGCMQYVRSQVQVPFLATGAAAQVPLPMPNSASLHGRMVYAQAFVVDPGSNAAGQTTSNALRIRIGQ